jgi:YebC/PmpR family DNA-binding regulatory protein
MARAARSIEKTCGRIPLVSGHSKWATIKRDKGANDAKRGAIFTKLGNAITIAVRQGRGLPLALDKAKAANMPKENIQRALDRGEGKLAGQQLVESTFEGFGPGGVAIIIETISDNNTRTAQFIPTVFEKNGGHLATPGSVSYLFSRVGAIEEQTLEKAMEVEALDFDEGTIYTKPEDLHKISEALGKQGSLIYRPNKETLVNLNPEDQEKLEKLLEAIDDLDDVQEVYVNV